MNKTVAVIISPNWRDYGRKYLVDCLGSLARQDYDGRVKFFLIDNESTAESWLWLQQTVKEVAPNNDYTILANTDNTGFARANNQALQLALAEGFTYVGLFNLDGVADSACLRQLVAAAESRPQAGALQARIMLWPERELVNSLGNVTHFLGFGYCDGYNKKLSSFKFQVSSFKEICYPSGAAVMFRAEALKQVGLFDEEFWMYNEDQDLGWRLWLAGWQCQLADQAVFYHKYEFQRSSSRYYWLDRNRLLAIFKNYRLASLILIAPALVIMEMGLFLFAIRGGWLKEKLRVYWYFLQPRTWRYLSKARRDSQNLRKVSDRKIVKLFSGKILYQEIDNPLLRLANPFFNLYWQIAKIFILW